MASCIKTKSLKSSQSIEYRIDQPVLEPLSFPDHTSKPNFSIPLFCLLCDKMFKDVGMEKSDALLHHLLVEHQFVIADVELIADFKSYVHYWKRRFRESPITEFCSVININSRAEDIGPKLQYNLLCDGLPEDKQLREQLQMNKLQGILQLQQQERTDSHFSRNCLFCNAHFDGNRSVLFQHMVDKHAFNVGLPDNLVYVNELLDKLEEKLNNLQCLFCGKIFKDRPTLKDHMRKKQHKKINPKNKEFDKYYLINYLEVGKNWHDILDEDDSEINKKSRDESWEDWQEESIPIHCLFCEVTSPVTQNILNHMKEYHNFDLLEIKKNEGLNFYEEVKIVNYIRRQVYNFKCIFCKEKFISKEALLRHLEEISHFQLPDKNTSWNQPQYFFPTFENDGLLCGLPDDDDEDDDNEVEENIVHGNDDSVNYEVHGGQQHSPHGNIRTDSEMSCNTKNENGRISICEKDKNDGGNNIGAVCDYTLVGNDKQLPADKNNDDNCEHDTEAKSELVNKNDLSSSILVYNDDRNKVSDDVVVGDNKQTGNKYDGIDGDDKQDRNVRHTIHNENESSTVSVSNDDGDQVSDNAVVSDDKQPNNKCTSSDDEGGDEQDSNVGHTNNELNSENDSLTLSGGNDDSGNVSDHAVVSEYGSNGDDKHGVNVGHNKNELNSENDSLNLSGSNDNSSNVCNRDVIGDDSKQ